MESKNWTEEMYETNLPQYLQDDLDTLKNADYKTCLSYDEYLVLLNSAINSAEVDDEITTEQAWYLRKKYLGLEKE